MPRVRGAFLRGKEDATEVYGVVNAATRSVDVDFGEPLYLDAQDSWPSGLWSLRIPVRDEGLGD